jgi:hypothetical protein
MTRSGMPKRWIGIRSCNWQQWTQYRQTPSCRHAQSWALVVTANLIEARQSGDRFCNRRSGRAQYALGLAPSRFAEPG